MTQSSLETGPLDRWIDDNRSVWQADNPAYVPAPPLVSDADADVAIIGGGFTGVSTALHLARRFPDQRIILLEAKALANGASGRNGGLMLNGINAHPRDAEEARRIYDVTSGGIDWIEATIREYGLDVSYSRRDRVCRGLHRRAPRRCGGRRGRRSFVPRDCRSFI